MISTRSVLKWLIIRGALCAIGLASALIAAELALRITDFPAPTTPVWDRPALYYMPQDMHDLRDRKAVMPKPPGVFRIAVAGDSFTFGPAMQFDDTFPKRLERFLNLNTIPDQVEVLNLGRPGFSTMQEERLVRDALALQSDLIVLQVTLNDAQQRMFQDEPPEVRDPFGPEGMGPAAQWLRARSKLAALIIDRLARRRSRQAYIDYHRRLFFEPRTWNLFRGAIHRIRKRCAEGGVPLAVAVFPLFDFTFDQSYPFQDVHQRLLRLFEALKIPALDLLHAFDGLEPARLQTMPGKDSHPNEIAHRIAAEQIYRWLVARGLVPARFKVKAQFAERQVAVTKKVYKALARQAKKNRLLKKASGSVPTSQ